MSRPGHWQLTGDGRDEEQPLGPPILPPNSLVNNASLRPATNPGGAIAPGSIVSLLGANLAYAPQVTFDVPLPTTLGETSVTFDGIAAPLFAVSGMQINAQVPFNVQPGQVSVQVKRGSEVSAVQTVTVAEVSPGIFSLNRQGTGQGAVMFQNYIAPLTFVAPVGSVLSYEGRPAHRLEVISIFCTGLGDVTYRPPNGAPPSHRSTTLQSSIVTIGGIEVPVSFSGLSKGYVGLYQVNAQVRQTLPPAIR